MVRQHVFYFTLYLCGSHCTPHFSSNRFLFSSKIFRYSPVSFSFLKKASQILILLNNYLGLSRGRFLKFSLRNLVSLADFFLFQLLAYGGFVKIKLLRKPIALLTPSGKNFSSFSFMPTIFLLLKGSITVVFSFITLK
jgi:hypothetical protein